MPAVGQTISHYEILNRLGGGGMGVVFKARDTKLERDVALKFLPPELSRDEEANRRFMQEAKAASALNHPNVCSIHDIKETDDGRLYIVMPFYDGQTLKYRLRSEDGHPEERPAEGGRREGTRSAQAVMPLSEALSIIRQIASGLAAAHKKGIIHRDIKPANIMVTDDGRVVILDFGLAKLTGGLELTKTGSTLGTAYYMSPEQIRGEAVDHRSDIWSVGVVLYQMLSGERPFRGDYEQAVSYAILNYEPDADFDPELASVVARCIKKERGERFQTAEELLEALRSFQSETGAQVTSKPSQSSGNRKKILGVTLGALTALLLAVFFALRSSDGPSDSNLESTRLVVLPFDNLGSPDDEYFADGMTEEITSRLASLRGMAVISQNTAVQYKQTDKTIREIGSELGVNYVLGGSVRWDKRSARGEMVRITPRLIRVSDDTNVWTETYEREIEGIFAIQTEVAEDVATQLNVTLGENEITDLSRPPTENLEAYQAYLRGKAILRDNTVDQVLAAPAFETAVRLDPGFLEAHYSLARTYLVGAWLGTPAEWRKYGPLAQVPIEKVHELAPGSSEDYSLDGYQAYYIDLDFERAREHFQTAFELDPQKPEVQQPLAWIHRRLGDHEKAAALLDQILEGDPQNLLVISEALWTHLVLRNHERVQELIDQAIQIQPTNRKLHCSKSWTLIRWKGDAEAARLVEDAAPETETDLPCWWADLMERKFERILSNLKDVDPDRLERDWYAQLFRSQAEHYHFRRALAARYSGDVDLERSSWSALLKLLFGHSDDDYQMERYRNPQAVSALGQALALAGLGDAAASRSVLDDLRSGIAHDRHLQATSRSLIAFAYALLDEKEEAISLLAEDLETTGIITRPLLESPYWDPLRDHPGFKALGDER